MIRLNWKVTVFSLACLVVFLRLGYWQLNRAEAKEVLLADTAGLETLSPVGFDELLSQGEPVSGTRVKLSGRYSEEDTLLLDNRILNGKVGFEVLVPFDVTDAGVDVLVNRGFVPMGRTRDQLPVIPPLNQGIAGLLAVVYVPGEARHVSGEWILPRPQLPIVQVPDVTAIGGATGRELYPYLLRLEESDPNALPRHWPVSVMLPEKHRGYAVQWFLMALAVLIAWSVFTYRTQEDPEHE